jgi:hypothetical protein
MRESIHEADRPRHPLHDSTGASGSRSARAKYPGFSAETKAEIFAARTPWRGLRRQSERQREFSRKEFFPAHSIDIARHQRRKIPAEHVSDFVAPA